MKRFLIDRAVKIALEKRRFHPEYENYMHYSFIVQDNKIIDWGVNKCKTPPVHYGYRSLIKHDPNFCPKSHSEIEAFYKAKNFLDRSRNFEIINIRITKSGLLRLSKPCGICYDLLKLLGCKKFYFSSEREFLTCC